ncbi:MAG: hypothetical protein IJ408_03330 [Clostridia bacterium]|nr:hypothetical protein [Clostridia bacterium]
MKAPIFTGNWGKCHIQGIAVDEQNGYIYYSFTTKLVKATLDGEIIGSVDGLAGHLGCIVFNKQDGRVYGSLEYKNDSIGKGILKAIGKEQSFEDSFYIAIFDVSKIDRLDMDAEKDSIMTSVYLKEVADDFNGASENGAKHKYGCSGIDGTAIGPMFGEKGGKSYLFVAYGIYGDTERCDNDHQIILCYDLEQLKEYEMPLIHSAMHKSGPEKPSGKYFVYTGNTTYGVQNMEYCEQENAYFMAVYRGTKKEFPNYYLFAIDASEKPVFKKLRGIDEEGYELSLLKKGLYHQQSGTYGYNFKYGSTGMYCFENGDWLISEEHLSQSGNCSFIYTYVRDENRGFVLKD